MSSTRRTTRWRSRRRQERQALPSFFTCGSPAESKVGSEVLTGKRDLAKAKQLMQEAGYKGEKIVVLSATDQPIVHRRPGDDGYPQVRGPQRGAGHRLDSDAHC